MPRAPLDQKTRRELIRRSHQLTARLTLGRSGVTEAFIAELDRTMLTCDLLKVRIEADSGKEATTLAGQLAEKVGASRPASGAGSSVPSPP